MLPLVYHDDYVVPLPDSHRFPMPKFRLLRDLLLRDWVALPEQIHAPERATATLLQRVHSAPYVQAFCDGSLDPKAIRRIGLPWSEALVKRTCTAVGGSVLTAQLALARGLACNLAGGTHHAFPDYGSGFCIFNDLAIATMVLLDQVERILILDLDVHQGDGTAKIFANQPRVFTLSMHCQANFPAIKQVSDLDIPLAVGTEDELYLQTLAAHLDDALSAFRPELVLYDAGVDPHHSDRLGKLALTNTGLYRRDMQVLTTCVRQGYPVAMVIGGGYGHDIPELVYRHSLLQRAATEVFRQFRL